jgi:hypothetical protein
LTQEGLLTRTTAEKKVLIVASKQVNNYDLSEKGRTSWTPDSAQPGYGNFCYGHREVTSIDNSTLGTNSEGAKIVAVSYHYQIANVADWANSPEMKTAIPWCRVLAGLESFGQRDLGHDRGSLGIHEVSKGLKSSAYIRRPAWQA